MKKGALKDTFMNSAAAGFFVRNSQWLSSWPFALGYGAMIAKGGMNPDLDTAAGILMIGAATCFAMQKKWPTMAFRLSGMLGASAALCLSAKGFNFETMEIINNWRFIAPLTGPLIANSIIGLQKEVASVSQKLSQSSNKLTSTFARAIKYPLITAACIDLTNGPNLMMAAISDGDWMFLGAIGVFAIGLLGIIASDPRVQENYKNFQASKVTGKAVSPAPSS